MWPFAVYSVATSLWIVGYRGEVGCEGELLPAFSLQWYVQSVPGKGFHAPNYLQLFLSAFGDDDSPIFPYAAQLALGLVFIAGVQSV